METNKIISEIKRLPISKRFYIVEKAMRSIQYDEKAKQMQHAADAHRDLYSTDKELVPFTNLDIEDFYETK